jgi:hypothetical protein
LEVECLRNKQRREKKKLSLEEITKRIDLHYKEGIQTLQ